MKYIIDTNILLWFLEKNKQLPENIAHILCEADNSLYISIVSLWEITIKSSLGKLNLKTNFSGIISTIENSENIFILPIKMLHLKYLHTLPLHHRDPFDRLIFAQSAIEDFEFLYTDKIFDLYRK